TLVLDLLELDALGPAAPPLDGPLDRVVGHVSFLRSLHRQAQARVALGIGAALARGDQDLAPQLGEELAALDVGCALLALDLRPLGVTRHETPARCRLGMSRL